MPDTFDDDTRPEAGSAEGPAPTTAGASTTDDADFDIDFGPTTSSRLSGTGELECPTKPVTDGVCRTVDQDSSVRSMRTST